jgi:hypothetical protein
MYMNYFRTGFQLLIIIRLLFIDTIVIGGHLIEFLEGYNNSM